ncbi:MAG: hypothetical protein E6I84_14510 [Chloroflexi bacterium]|nr:MAG: hypothetical protein E6I84_14510 [Chloroflexota bacterium]TMH46363.1 MAG: hypothetical protein E6H54_02895 [Betaproteobacteria bacterium]
MKTLTASIVAIILIAATVAALIPGNTPGVVLALGSPFALFANVMSRENAPTVDGGPQARNALLVDWM